MLPRKGVSLYECMDEWEMFNETTLSEKEEFYNSLNMEDITDLKTLKKKLGEHHDLYLKSDTLLLVDVFKNFTKMCLKIYHPIKFLSAPGLADIENGGGMCNKVHGHAKTNNKYMTGYNKESSYLNYWDVNNLYGWEMLQKFLVKKFNGLKIFLNLMKIL